MVSTRIRAERAVGELADWLELLSTLLEVRLGRLVLSSGVLARFIAAACRASAVTLGGVIVFSSDGWKEVGRGSEAGLVLLAHELVHVRQFRQRGFVRFLWLYGSEYCAGRWRGWSHWRAYREISFEKEARRGEQLALFLLRRGALLRGDWSSNPGVD